MNDRQYYRCLCILIDASVKALQVQADSKMDIRSKRNTLDRLSNVRKQCFTRLGHSPTKSVNDLVDAADKLFAAIDESEHEQAIREES